MIENLGARKPFIGGRLGYNSALRHSEKAPVAQPDRAVDF